MNTDIPYFRGLMAARLANNDNWVAVFAGSKAFVNFMANRARARFKGLGAGLLIISPHALVAGDIVGHPEVWVMIMAHPKETDSVESERERGELAELLRLMGQNEPLCPEQDILVIIEPNAPRWTATLVGNYLEFIRTGEGVVEPQPRKAPQDNPYCTYIPSTGFHTHCVGRDAALAFEATKEGLRDRPFEVLNNPTQCMAPNQRLSGTFRNGLNYHMEDQP